MDTSMFTDDPFSAGQPLSVASSIAGSQTSSSETSVPVKNNMDRFASTICGAGFGSSPWAKIQYTIDELRVLRHRLPQVICNLLAMKDSAGDILTLPYGILANPNPQPIATRRLNQLPRGNMMRSRFDTGRRSTEDSDNEEIVYRGHPSKKALGVSTHWQYRRSERSLTDDLKNMQPRTAPVGVDAQKAENFRKFYRAVVSPTHVRVTAGGRIVPNSRAPAQPVFVWNKDRVAFDTVAGSADAQAQLNGGNQVGQKRLQSTDSSFDMSGQTSTRSSFQKSDSSATAQSLENKDVAAQSSMPVVATQPQLAAQGLKISPPENFDPNRPFYLNGCLVSPLPRDIKLPPGLHPVPLSMIGNTGQQQLQYQQQQQVMGAFQSNAPAFLAPQNQNQRLMPAMVGPTAYPYHVPSQLPAGLPIADIAGSRLNHHKSTPALNNNVYRMDRLSPKALNAQRKSFQDEIERIDHQLKYNTHQTDEKHENQKRQYILEQISVIEQQLNAMGFAPMAQPRSSVQDRRAVAVRALDLTKPLDKNDSFAEPSSISGLSTGFKTQVSLRETASESTPRSAASMVTTLARAAAALNIPVAPPSTDTKPPLPKKRLSLSCAKAPEFKPRSLLTVDSANAPAVIANDSNRFTTPVKGVMDAKQAAQASVPAEPRMLAYSEEIPPAFATYQSTVPYQQVPLAAQTSSVSNVGPYLSGYVQPGLSESGVPQFNYSRPLTESELLARKLYWGSGGKQHQQKGLPKFDGKDFYPPSPTKPSAPSGSQSRASEASTVLRKYNSSAVTSKASEESGVLQRLDEEDAPVTPRRNQVNRKASAPGLQLKSTDDNKENVEIIKSTDDLDAWCAKNDIHMPDGGTPITRTKTASLLAKLANIPSPKFRLTRDSKPASVAASERSESYALPKLLARGASKAVAAASDEFAPARPSASTQTIAVCGIPKFQTATPGLIEALQAPALQGELKRPAKSNRSVSGSVASAAVFDPAMGTFAGPAMRSTHSLVKKQETGVTDRSQVPGRSIAAREYLQMVARNDAVRAQETHGLEQQKVVTLERDAAESAMAGQRTRTNPQPGTEAMTAAESLAVHQQAYLAKNPPLHPRPVDGISHIPPPGQPVQQAKKLPLKYAVPPTLAAPSAVARQAPPVQGSQNPMHYPPPMQFQYPPPPMPYHMGPGPGHPAFQVPLGPGQQYQVPMPPGQPYPGQGQGQWVWHGAQAPPAPQQGPPPAR